MAQQMEGGMPTQPMQSRKICRHWAMKGTCYMADACGFLHPRDIEGNLFFNFIFSFSFFFLL